MKKLKAPVTLHIHDGITIIDRELKAHEIDAHRNHDCHLYEQCLDQAEKFIKNIKIRSKKTRNCSYSTLNYSFTCKYCRKYRKDN